MSFTLEKSAFFGVILLQVRVRKRVGIVFEWLPNGSLEDLLAYFRPSFRSLSRSSRKQLTPQLVLDCQSSRWAASASSSVNNGANGGVNGSGPAAVRRRLPDELASRPVSEMLAMPCDSDAIAALGHDWVRLCT